VFASSFIFSQNNETTNNVRVIGSFDLGSQEVTTILDETTGCVRKTSPHSKGLFTAGEIVKLKISETANKAEVLKQGLVELVFTKKWCNSEDVIQDLEFSNQDVTTISEFFSILKIALIDLTKNEQVKTIVNQTVQNSASNERIYLSYLQKELALIEVDLLILLQNSLQNYGGSSDDIQKLKNNWSQINISNDFYDLFIFVPFSDVVNFTKLPAISSSINGKSNKPKIDGIIYDESTDNKILEIKIDENSAQNSPVWILSLSASSDIDLYPALPWQKCHCSRGIRLPTGELSTQGECGKKGECGDCGRANFRGVCGGSHCPGC